jgi:glyoxalase family protein
VLFELATVTPGFTADEPIASLGRSLKLPPWEEPNRDDIESSLAHVSY